MRLDKKLRELFPAYSRQQLKAFLRSGRIRVNGHIVRTGIEVADSDVITVADELHHGPGPVPQADLDLPIIYESTTWLAVNKHAGQNVYPLSPNERGTLANAIVARFPETIEAGRAPLQAGCVHRLDKDTSGLVLVARTQQAFTNLWAQFCDQSIKKIYTALVEGILEQNGSIDSPIANRGRSQSRVSTKAPDGLPAQTNYEVLQTFANATLLRVQLIHGRRHQIRVHLASMGHPVAGDVLYGAQKNPNVARHYLHAQKLELIDPDTGKPIIVEADSPPELQLSNWVKT